MRRMVAMMVVVAALAGAARPGLAAPAAAEEEHYGSDAGYGTLAALSTLLYTPFKLVYAAIGGFTGCLTYLVTVGDLDTAEQVWSVSMGGSYVITPAMFHGQEDFFINGASHEKK